MAGSWGPWTYKAAVPAAARTAPLIITVIIIAMTIIAVITEQIDAATAARRANDVRSMHTRVDPVSHGEFLHSTSDLRIGDRRHHGAGRRHLLFPAAGVAIPRHHTAASGGERQLSRRQRASRRRYRHHAARAADQRRAGHDLHVLDELERRLLDHHHHL